MLPPLLLFKTALVPMAPELGLVIVTAPELFHTAPVPNANPPEAMFVLPTVVSTPLIVPPVQVSVPAEGIVAPAELNDPPFCVQFDVVIVDAPISSEPPVMLTVLGVQLVPVGIVTVLVPLLTVSAPAVNVDPVKAVIVLVPPLNISDPAAPFNVPDIVLTPPAKFNVVPVPM